MCASYAAVRTIAIALAVLWANPGVAQELLPSDVSIQLSAQPSMDIAPGEPITLTIAVSNLGPLPVEVVLFDSTELSPNDFDITHGTADCPLRLFVTDGSTGYFYLYTWPIGSGEDPPLAPFETRTCHLNLTLASTASQAVPLEFFMSHLYADPNPSNDSGSVVLRRAAAAITPVPTTSIGALLALAIVLISVVAALRQSGR